MVVVVVNDSTALDLSQVPSSDMGSTIEDIDLDALGLFLVHKMMDSVEYRRLARCNVMSPTKKTTHETA